MQKNEFASKIVNTALDPSTAHFTQVTVTSGTTLSSSQSVDTVSILGFRLPATWDGGVITFLESITSDGTYRQMYDSTGAAISVNPAASPGNTTIKDPTFTSIFYGIPFIKIQCANAPSADRVIDIIMANV